MLFRESSSEEKHFSRDFFLNGEVLIHDPLLHGQNLLNCGSRYLIAPLFGIFYRLTTKGNYGCSPLFLK